MPKADEVGRNHRDWMLSCIHRDKQVICAGHLQTNEGGALVTKGYRQAVRHDTLTVVFVGSIPTSPVWRLKIFQKTKKGFLDVHSTQRYERNNEHGQRDKDMS